MRVFQNFGLYPAYVRRLNKLASSASSFSERLQVFLSDSFGACHLLKPVIDGDADAFFTTGDDVITQRFWATEHGLAANTTPEQVLLSQIEHHRTEVFYNLDPVRYGNDFIKKLPGTVKRSIAWRAAPSGNADFGAYNLLVCNFPTILQSYRDRGWRAEYFAPGHDPEMDGYADNGNRPIDVLFVGGYSRHHRKRAEILEAVSELRKDFRVVYRLDRSRLTRLAEAPLGWLLPLNAHRRPKGIRAVSSQPVFGRDLYRAISQAKIVLNGAVDMAGSDRGNMRCWEALGCGALMVSDAGNYPDGMIDRKTIITYDNAQSAVASIRSLLADQTGLREIAVAGNKMIKSRYSKEAQWSRFTQLCW
ncbi:MULTISPECIES: glycosyltransferase [Rhizobium]|uniref:glycosyltransferase family protein n=1 Tax=Rhizobium phaseoli TaxID=396 RepID=UPI000A1C143A|nr:glycosyltransferase [Rhizobium phaseoli]ARM12157.1 glycosyltransferase family 1 protein [Rhizobium phaseoli Brasil 5]